MSENPHLLGNEIHASFGTGITGSNEPFNFAARITGLANEFPTGTVEYRHIFDRAIRELYRNLENHGYEGLQSDEVDAGFVPTTITGFFDSSVNPLL
jgi:hypothetical protein